MKALDQDTRIDEQFIPRPLEETQMCYSCSRTANMDDGLRPDEAKSLDCQAIGTARTMHAMKCESPIRSALGRLISTITL